MLVAAGLYFGASITRIWDTTHSIPGVLFLTSAALGALTLGYLAVRRYSRL